MKRAMFLIMAAIFFAVPAMAAFTYGFVNVSGNNSYNAQVGEDQLYMLVDEVTVNGDSFANFTFGNTGPVPTAVAVIYFDDYDDDFFLGNPDYMENDAETAFEYMSGGTMPAWNQVNPSFEKPADFSFAAKNPAPFNGINADESWMVRMNYNSTYSQLIKALNDGSLRVGMHVRAFPNGGSEAFVNTPDIVPPGIIPAPSALLLAGLGVTITGWLRNKKAI
jgi:hypothetical protein